MAPFKPNSELSCEANHCNSGMVACNSPLTGASESSVHFSSFWRSSVSKFARHCPKRLPCAFKLRRSFSASVPGNKPPACTLACSSVKPSGIVCPVPSASVSNKSPDWRCNSILPCALPFNCKSHFKPRRKSPATAVCERHILSNSIRWTSSALPFACIETGVHSN